MSGRSQVKVLEKPDDWWTWNAYITSLAETLWSARYTPGREALPRSADSTDPSIDSSYQQARSAPVEPQLALGRPQTTEPIRWIIKCSKGGGGARPGGPAGRREQGDQAGGEML